MIDYILKSGICLTLLLAIYHLFLERMKMHGFNRFYLLISLVFGLLAPLITIEIAQEAAPFIPTVSGTDFIDQIPVIMQEDTNVVPAANNSTAPDLSSILIFLYGLVTGIFLTRFAGNIFKIISKVSKNPKLPIKKASLVLTADDSLPHSFLNYIFINAEDYRNNRVEDQLLEHELTHVRQKHSIDILFIEIIRIVFWFNPIFILYKRTIQLNHEFLADEAVVQSYDVSAYQYLLLEKSISKGTVELASNLNFSVTKKRLTMMIKTTSRLKIWIARLTVIPILVIILFFFSNMVVSIPTPDIARNLLQKIPVKQSVQPKPQIKPVPIKFPPPVVVFFGDRFPSSKTPAPQSLLDEYAAIADKYTTDYLKRKPVVTVADKSNMEILYRQMSKEQQKKQKIMFESSYRKPYDQLIPSDVLFESWKNPAVYGVWIDGKHIKNEELNQYKPSDFSYYHKSNLAYTDLMKKNVMKHFNLAVMYKYQLNIQTNDYFNKENATIVANLDKSLMFYVIINTKDQFGSSMMQSEDMIQN